MPRLRARTIRRAEYRAESRVGLEMAYARPIQRGRPSNVPSRQSELLTLLSAVETATTAELAHAVGLGSQRTWYLLDLLEAEGRVERVGQRRAMVWRLP